MYFNDVFIGYYVMAVFLGFIAGKLVAWCNHQLPIKGRFFSKEFFRKDKEGLKYVYFFMISIATTYVFLLYRYGINFEDFFGNLDLLKFYFLTPMLFLVFFIDFSNRIIPNRLNLTIFEIGLTFTFIYGITNLNMAKDYILGMLTGAGIYFIITILGKLISGKEAMGYGDVKFMGAIGLFYGTYGILDISLGAFFVGAVVSIFILIFRFFILRSKDEYVSFGPFLAMMAFICMFIQSGMIVSLFMSLCEKISYLI